MTEYVEVKVDIPKQVVDFLKAYVFEFCGEGPPEQVMMYLGGMMEIYAKTIVRDFVEQNADMKKQIIERYDLKEIMENP